MLKLFSLSLCSYGLKFFRASVSALLANKACLEATAFPWCNNP